MVTPTTKPRRTAGFNLQRCVFAATALVCGTSPPRRRLCRSSPYACWHAGAYGKSGLVAIHVVCVLARRRTRVNSIIRLRQSTFIVCVLTRRHTRVIFRNRLTTRTALLSSLLVSLLQGIAAIKGRSLSASTREAIVTGAFQRTRGATCAKLISSKQISGCGV